MWQNLGCNLVALNRIPTIAAIGSGLYLPYRKKYRPSIPQLAEISTPLISQKISEFGHFNTFSGIIVFIFPKTHSRKIPAIEATNVRVSHLPLADGDWTQSDTDCCVLKPWVFCCLLELREAGFLRDRRNTKTVLYFKCGCVNATTSQSKPSCRK